MDLNMENILSIMQEDIWIDSSFEEELLEFTKANQVERERKLQNARSRGASQKDLDRERKNINRKQDSAAEASNPWKGVVIVRTNQDGKVRLIPKNDFEPGRHELLYGQAPGQPPKPEVTPNVAQEVSSQEDFEASKTSNRLLGVQMRKKQPKQEIVRSDHYDYPKDGIERIDPSSTYADWDHSPESVSQGIALVANTASGREVNVQMIQGMFGNSQTLMDSSIRAFQQIGERIKGQFFVEEPMEAYPVNPLWTQGIPTMGEPITDLIIKTQDGKSYNCSIIQDKTKVITEPESQQLFDFIMMQGGIGIELMDKDVKKKLEKLKESVTNFINSYQKNQISKKYSISSEENFKIEIISKLEEILEESNAFEKVLVLEALTGTQKFGEGSPAAANVLMSMARDGTNLKLCPMDEPHVRRLLGETNLKLKFQQEGPSQFDQMLAMLTSKTESVPEITEFFNIAEDVTDAKVMFDQFMQMNESILVSFLTFLGLRPETIVIENINLDAVGSISSGNFTKVVVNNRNFYIEVEKDINYYDGKAIKLPELMPLMPPEMMGAPVDAAGAPMPPAGPAPVQEEVDLILEKKKRNYKKEYREYHSKSIQKKRRAGRNNIRRKYVKKYGKDKLKGKDIDHKDHNPLNNGSGNVRLRDKSDNRGDNKVPVCEEHGAGEEGTMELLLRYLSDTPGQSIPRNLLKKGNKYATQRKRTEDRYKEK